ncbi:sugar phosphate permease [Rhodococcus wratislaviensis]|uniref:MFS transporter n=2 Tax=Rhodococcus wratislaviensis TaxID=44752 RepID=A0AB38FEV3_RHOWR|nr:sugar phosphate permease [Rhodococcus wratislaviensis]SPZ39998.1 MFS transporter [Rhodococcus wratislaviensis]
MQEIDRPSVSATAAPGGSALSDRSWKVPSETACISTTKGEDVFMALPDDTERADDPADGGRRVAPAVSAPTARTAWSITFLVMILQTINFADKAVLGIVARPLSEDLGLSNADIGLLGSAFYVLFVITGLVGGFIADRVRIVWVLLALALLWSLVQIPVLLVGTFTALIVSRVLLGAAEGPAGALNNVAVFGWFPKSKRGLPSAVVSSGTSLSKILMAPALTVIVAAYGWKAAFWTLMIVGLVWAAVWLVVGKDGPYSVSSARQVARSGAPDGNVTRVSFLRIAALPTFWGGVLGMFAIYGMVAVILTWLPSYFEQGLGFSRVDSGLLFALPSVTGMASMLLVSFITDRLAGRGMTVRVSRGMVSVVALFACGVMLASIPLVHSAWLAVFLVVAGYGAGVASYPLMNVAVAHISPERQVASTLGVFTALFSTSGILAPWLTGHLVDAATTPAEGYTTAFQIFGVVAIIGAVVMALTVDPERDRARIAAIDTLTSADDRS